MWSWLQYVGMMDSASIQAPAQTMFDAQILKISSAFVWSVRSEVKGMHPNISFDEQHLASRHGPKSKTIFPCAYIKWCLSIKMWTVRSTKDTEGLRVWCKRGPENVFLNLNLWRFSLCAYFYDEASMQDMQYVTNNPKESDEECRQRPTPGPKKCCEAYFF